MIQKYHLKLKIEMNLLHLLYPLYPLIRLILMCLKKQIIEMSQQLLPYLKYQLNH